MQELLLPPLLLLFHFWVWHLYSNKAASGGCVQYKKVRFTYRARDRLGGGERRQTCGQWCSANFENSPPIAGGPLQMRCSTAARSPPPLRTAYTPLSLSHSLTHHLVCAFISSRHRICFILQIVWPNNCIFCNT